VGTLFRSSEVAFNVFETYRSAESGFVELFDRHHRLQKAIVNLSEDEEM